jgi:hypothetical protein
MVKLKDGLLPYPQRRQEISIKNLFTSVNA